MSKNIEKDKKQNQFIFQQIILKLHSQSVIMNKNLQNALILCSEKTQNMIHVQEKNFPKTIEKKAKEIPLITQNTDLLSWLRLEC